MLAALAVAALAVVLVVVLSGETTDPFAYTAAKRADFERRAAAGEAHLLYANSPGGVVATAKRVAALDGPIRSAATASHVDPGMLEGMVFLESGGQPGAIAGGDPAGAAGVAQILPDTARTLLGLHVDLAASKRLSAQIDATRDPHQRTALEKQRRTVDERFDAAKAIAAMGRYLTFARGRLDGGDLAVESYHMGVGNLESVIGAYTGDHGATAGVVRDRSLTYAQVYFDSTPLHNSGAYGKLAALGDDSDTYLWRVLAARDIMALYRSDPARLAQINKLQTSYPSAEAALHPPGSTPVFASAPAPGLKPPRRNSGYTFASSVPAQDRVLRPEAAGALIYIADRVQRVSRAKAPLIVNGALRPSPTYSPDATGFSFDIARRYASHGQAEAFQNVLNRLQALDVIAWAREGDVIHVTASQYAAALTPLLHGASLGDSS